MKKETVKVITILSVIVAIGLVFSLNVSYNGFSTKDIFFSPEKVMKEFFLGGGDSEPIQPICTPTTEICDGIDNDCDSFIDEGGVCGIAGEEIISDDISLDYIKSEFANNVDWIVELKRDPVLKFKSDIEKSQTSSVSSVDLNSYKLQVIEEHDEFKSRLPTGIVVKREFINSLNGIAITASYDSLSNLPRDMIKTLSIDSDVYPTLIDALPIMNVDGVWQLQDSFGLDISGEGITIAIMDSGVDYTHPDFGSCIFANFPGGPGCEKFVNGWDVFYDRPDPMDEYGHGTHVASIAAGKGDYNSNNIYEPELGEVWGVAPNAKLLVYRVLAIADNDEDALSGKISAVITGIDLAMDPNQDGDFSDHADVIHFSLGAPGDSNDLWSQAVDNAVDNGAIVTASAGNNGPELFTLKSPGNSRKVITVGATCKSRDIGVDFLCPTEVTSFSSRGPTSIGIQKPDVVAPGHLICAAQSSIDTIWQQKFNAGVDVHCIDNQHISISGTSMAGPMVAGVVALVKQAHPSWTPQEIKNTIKGTAVDLFLSPLEQGAGRVDALSAVQATNSYPTSILNNEGNMFVGGVIDIIGTAQDNDLSSYVLEYGEGIEPSVWIQINTDTISVVDGVLGSLDTNIINDEIFTVKLTSTDSSSQSTIDYLYLFPRVSYWKEGWPKQIAEDTTYKRYGPVFGDLDGDGNIEIIASSPGLLDSKVYVWDSDGNLLPGWPQDVVKNGGSVPALGDVDGDGDLEIVYESTSFFVDQKTMVYVWNDDGTSLNSNWPKEVQYGLLEENSPVLEDIDNDGKDEIIITTADIRLGTLSIRVFNEDGSEIFGGWNQVGSITTSPIFCDWNNDGVKDMVFETGKVDNLYVWDVLTGTLFPDFPISFGNGNLFTNIAMNFDGDVGCELLIGNQFYDDGVITSVNPFVLGNDGGAATVLASGFPVRGGDSPPLVGDVTGDGIPEIITFEGREIFAWDSFGNLVSGWPIDIFPQSFLSDFTMRFSLFGGSIGDVDNDGKNEIGFTIFTSTVTRSTGVIDSLGTYVFIIDTEGLASSVEWPMYQFDERNSGFYEPTLNFCGDGLLNWFNECDDGNTKSGDGCSSICTIETGFGCVGEPSVCSCMACGDGLVCSGIEQCDDGGVLGDDGCDNSCNINPEWECSFESPSVCTDISEEVIQLTTSPFDQKAASMHLNTIAYLNGSGNIFDVVLHDLDTGQVSGINSNIGGKSSLFMYGDNIVYRPTNSNTIYLYKISTGQETLVSTTTSIIGLPWGVYEDNLITTDGDLFSTTNLNLIDLLTGQKRILKIANFGIVQAQASIWKNKVVTNINGNTFDIFVYDIDTDTETQITNDGFVQEYPDIYGDKIVWQDKRNGNYDIYMYNLLTNTETRITTDSFDQTRPKIYGNYIAWNDKRHGNSEIYLYSLLNNEEIRITKNGADQTLNDLYENNIFWTDKRNVNQDIYMHKITFCSDGTPSGQCSGFNYCINGELVNNRCDICGCASGGTCPSEKGRDRICLTSIKSDKGGLF